MSRWLPLHSNQVADSRSRKRYALLPKPHLTSGRLLRLDGGRLRPNDLPLPVPLFIRVGVPALV
jgi:hypothetical protein